MISVETHVNQCKRFSRFYLSVRDFQIPPALHAWSFFVVLIASLQASWLASLWNGQPVGNVSSQSWLSEIRFSNPLSFLFSDFSDCYVVRLTIFSFVQSHIFSSSTFGCRLNSMLFSCFILSSVFILPALFFFLKYIFTFTFLLPSVRLRRVRLTHRYF